MASPNIVRWLRPAVLALIVWSVLLAACSPTPTLLPTSTIPPSASPTSAPTATAQPSATTPPTVTPSPAPSATPAPTHTPTAVPTPTSVPAAFDKLQIISISNGIGGVKVIFRIPGIQVAYQVKIRGYDYNCVLDATAPDRLFCTGLAVPPFDVNLDLTFIDPNSHQTVYTGKTIYSSALGATATVQGWGKNDCPGRGTNVSCETECRLLPNGNPCIVSTCSDACGLYFSVDTCPADMSMDFPSCPPDLFAEMKARYSIP
jgi:hypothetical protein